MYVYECVYLHGCVYVSVVFATVVSVRKCAVWYVPEAESRPSASQIATAARYTYIDTDHTKLTSILR